MLVPLFICGTFFLATQSNIKCAASFQKSKPKAHRTDRSQKKAYRPNGGGEEERTLSRAGILESIADSTQH